MIYRALKKNWITYQEAFEKYKINADYGRFIKKIPDQYKEKIGKTWVVNELWFKAFEEDNIKTIYQIKEN